MPELPEVEITSRLLDGAVRGRTVESVAVPGLNTLKTFDPPVDALVGHELTGVRRRGKILLVDSEAGLSILIHLMSAGRLQFFGKSASPKDRRSRLLLRLGGDDELRLREFGTHQRAWVRLVHSADVDQDEYLATLGPEAWPDPPAPLPLLDSTGPLYTALRDQKVIAGIGRAWVDEMLWSARLSPFKRGVDLSEKEADGLRSAMIRRLGEAISTYERDLSLPLPDRIARPLEVHHREGEPCPSCGAVIEAVHFRDYVMCYCPAEQTGGKSLKDRRLSKLLK